MQTAVRQPSHSYAPARDQLHSDTVFQLDRLAATPAKSDPFPYIVADNLLPESLKASLKATYPQIERHGFFPLSTMQRQGAFDRLITDLEGPRIAEILSEKLDIDLTDKPRLITVRKWSQLKDGYIHNDSESKIVTALLYLNENWPHGQGGAFRILRDDHDFENMLEEVPPLYGTFVAFKRSATSWHGHKPVEGERRVIQVTWLRSQDDYDRKTNRGKRSLFLKTLFAKSRKDGDGY